MARKITYKEYKDVFKKKVFTLLDEDDRRWWKDFDEEQGCLIPSIQEQEEYENVWNIIEGESQAQHQRTNMLRTNQRKNKPIVIEDHPYSILDFEVNDIIIYHSDENDSEKRDISTKS